MQSLAASSDGYSRARRSSELTTQIPGQTLAEDRRKERIAAGRGHSFKVADIGRERARSWGDQNQDQNQQKES